MKAGAIVLRAATLADVPAVLEIERNSFSDPWGADAFGSALSLPHFKFLVAEEAATAGVPGRRLLGYIIIVMMGLEQEIANIAVTQEDRGQGIGRALLDQVCDDQSRNTAQTMYLEVRESNSAARSLYESRGFREVGRRKKYYRKPDEDALLLRRDFDGT